MPELIPQQKIDRSTLPVLWLTHPWAGPLVLVASAIAMVVWTWGRYCDPFVDFGREIYVAWRLSAGEVLYRDIDYFNGPVSPYLNALIFRVFGASLLALEIANLVWWGLLAVMAYRLYVAISDRLSAFVAMLLFIALFSFVQFTDTGNYNFVTPYAHEMTHALVCAFGVLTLLRVYLDGSGRGDWKLLAVIGGMLGLIFLMKVEVTLATAGAVSVGVAMKLMRDRARPGQWIRSGLILVAGALAPCVVTLVILRTSMSWGEAMSGLLGSWKYLNDSRITANPFYRNVMGTNWPWKHTVQMLWTLANEVGLLVPGAILALCIGRKSTSETRWLAASCAVGYVTVVLWIFWDRAEWQWAVKPLNAIVIATILGLGGIAVRRRGEVPSRLILQISFGVFALGLLAKIFLNITIRHYGFALTGPAFALVVLMLMGWIPGFIDRAGGSGWVFRAAVMTALVCFGLWYLNAYATIYRSRPAVTVGSGADQFQVYRSGDAIDRTLNFISRLPTGDTVAAVPQGAMINYLSRRVNPTGEVTLLPGEVEMFGEGRILDRFTQHRPDWIVAVQTNVSEFGFKAFGADYAEGLGQFVKENYDQISVEKQDSTLHLLRFDPGHRFRDGKNSIDDFK